MLYKDLYACDLSLALAGGAIETIDKPYCMACIYSALRTIHEFGLQHRYINANSIYVTTTGVPKVRFDIFVFTSFSLMPLKRNANLWRFSVIVKINPLYVV